MEGVGFIERMSYELLESLGCDIGESITVAGGAIKAPVWTQLRADIMGKTLLEPKVVEASMGAAIIAGTRYLGRTLEQSAGEMVSYFRSFAPDMVKHRRYSELYDQFKEQCRLRGYIE